MNLDIEAEQGHDRGIETIFVTETRASCRNFEGGPQLAPAAERGRSVAQTAREVEMIR